MSKEEITINQEKIKLENFKKEILEDYRLARISREASLLGRREVLTAQCAIAGLNTPHIQAIFACQTAEAAGCTVTVVL